MASENDSVSAASAAPLEHSEHQKAAAAHLKKRVAQKLSNATGKSTKRKARAIDKPLEPRPSYDGTTGKERSQIAAELSNQRKADTSAATERPSELTPLELERIQRSEKVKDSKKKPSRLNKEAKERARRDRFNAINRPETN